MKLNNRTKTRRRTAFVLTLLLTISLVSAVVYYSFRSFYDLAQKKEIELCKTTLEEEAAKIKEVISVGTDTVRTTAVFIESSMERGESSKEIDKLLTSITKTYREAVESDFTGVYGLFDGKYIDGAGWIPDEDYVPQKRPWYWNAVEAKGVPAFARPYVDAETMQQVISISVMLKDGESVLAIDVKAEKIQAVIDALSNSSDTYGLIMDSEGYVLFNDDINCNGMNIRNEEGRKRFGGEKTDTVRKVVGESKLDGETDHIFSEIDGKKVMAFAYPIFSNWYIVMVKDYDSIFRQEMEVLYNSILLSLLIVAVVAYFCTSVTISRGRVEDQAVELNEKASELKRASTEKSKFLANMSHEIRTPINAVLGMNEMILRESTNSTITGYSEKIRSASKTLLSIVNDVLDFSKIEAGEMSIIPVEYNTMTLLRDAYNVVEQRAADKKVELRVFNNTVMPLGLFGDETRIRQILTNLLNNAIKYTTEGLVTVEMDFNKEDENSGNLFISVTDTGIGISDEDKNKLFASYVRVDQKRNRNIEGTGLGLSITKQLVALMGGRIMLESEYGMGSKFSVEIPQKITDNTPMGVFAETHSLDDKSSGKYKESFRAPDAQILVVDDVDMNLEVMKGLLKTTGVKITTATNGLDCIDLAKQNRYDIIFMDHLMPDMDGVETFKKLKNIKNCINADTPVIVLTANAVAGAKEEYIKEGFADYLSKPVQGAVLEEMVHRFLPKEKIAWEEREVERQTFVQAPVSSVEEGNKKADTESKPASVKTAAEKAKNVVETKASFITFKSDGNKPVKAIKRVGSGIKKRFFGNDTEMNDMMFNACVIFLLVGCTITTITSWIIGNPLTVFLADVANVVLSLICVAIIYMKKQGGIATPIILFIAIDISIPLIFFRHGGLDSAIPLWMVLGLVLPWILTRGIAPYVLYGISVLVYAAAMLVSEIYPETVIGRLTGTELVIHSSVSLLFITLFFGLFIKYQSIAFNRQRTELLETTNELESSFKEIEKANNAKTEFLTNMSHELRTPINAILGYTEMIAIKTAEPKTAEYAANVGQAGRNLLAVVSDILDYTGMGTSDFEIEFVPSETIPSMVDIISYAQYNAGKKNLAVEFKVNPELPSKIKGDSMRYTQVCTNLVSNAVKYTEKGKISIDIDYAPIPGTDKCEITFSVEDTGIGIKPEDMERISKQYLRVDKSQNGSKQGAGIGLAFAVRILEKMGTELHAESRYGRGSRFWFTIRPHIIDPTPVGEINFSGELYRSPKEEKITIVAPDANVLAVDDNAMNLDLFGKLLEDTKMKIDYAEDGLEAVDKAKRKHYDLIFMDHMLPVMDGMEALNVLRREHICDDTPIIVLTANAVAGEKKKYLDAGFDEYLSKPVDRQRLLKVISEHLPVSLFETFVTEKNVSSNASDRETEIILEAEREAEKQEDDSSLSQEDKEFLKAAEFLDTTTGMSYCCDDVSFYKKMLQSYITNARAEEIKQAYAERNFENYRIFVHAVKGTSLTIGATTLSEHMKSMEFASRDGKIDFVDEHHEEYLKEYEEMIAKIEKLLST